MRRARATTHGTSKRLNRIVLKILKASFCLLKAPKKTYSELFDIAHLLEAGIAPREAVDRLLGDETENPTLLALRAALKKGYSFSRAMALAGIAEQLESAILAVAETAGKLSEALRLVAARAEVRAQRVARIRWRFWVPNFVLLIALVTSSVRTMAEGAATTATFFNAAAIACVLVGASQLLLTWLSGDPSRRLALGWRLGLYRTSDSYRAFFEQTFFTLFAWQCNAGVDYHNGAKTLAQLIPNGDYAKRIGRYRRSINNGESVVTALRHARLLHGGELEQVMLSGETAGRLGDALEHYLDAQANRIEQLTAQIFAWLPRAYYLLVIAIAALYFR